VLDPSLIVGLEHFGSTAIPGLSAKPIIDILIAVRSLSVAQVTFVEALRGLDYVYWAKEGPTVLQTEAVAGGPSRHFAAMPLPPRRPEDMRDYRWTGTKTHA
jgi:GrpB-like predicted nucleotidyltransferase (UPF0157 family)